MEDTTTYASNMSPRLYGRANEMEQLRQWYDATVVNNDATDTTTKSANRMLLGVVSGPDGIGKRALIHTTLLPHVKQSNGLFLSGQFHSVQHDKSTGKMLSSRPYGAICEALNQLVPSLNDDDMDDNNSSKATLRESLLAHFAGDGDRLILSELVKSLSQWIFRFQGDDNPQPQPENAASPTSYMHPPFAKLSSINIPNAQRDVLVRLIQLIALHIPLVLYLGHVESADCASFELLELLVNNGRTTENHIGTRLLLVLSLVDESVLPTSILTYTQQIDTTEGTEEAIALRKMISVEILRLRPIPQEHIFTWVIEHFGRNDHNDHVLQEVADMIYENSDCGNAQYILFHLSYLSLHIDVDGEWNDATIDIFRNTITNCSSNEIYTMKILQNANSDIRTVVDLVAVLIESGRHCVDATILEIVLNQPCVATLDAAQAIGLLESVNGYYCIPAPELQSVVYRMIPESKRTPLHLRIGRKLWKHINLEDPMTDESADMLDIISRNLQLGQCLVTDMLEMDIIVRINLSAGKHAAASSCFVAAAAYFEAAMSALGNRAWTADCYDVSLVLYNCSSEAYYCVANYERMDETLDAVLVHARSLHDKLQAYTTLLYANGARGCLKEALDTTLDVLHQLDEDIPTNAGILTFSWQYFKTKRLLHNKSVRYFLSLPAATNEDKIAVMQMLNFTMMYAYMIYPMCGAIATFRLIQLALKYGMAAPAVSAFGSFGFLSCLIMRDRELGVHSGKIALALLDQSSAKKFFLARTYLFVHGGVNYWGFPLRESLEPLRLANWSARKTGDIEGYGNTAYYYIELSCLAGRPLALLEYESRLVCEEKASMGQDLGLLYLVPQYEFIRDLVGRSPVPLHVTGGIVDATSALMIAEKNGNKPAIGTYYFLQAMLCCFHGKYYDAIKMTKKSRVASPVANLWLSFHEGISALAIARNVTGRKRWHFLCVGRRAINFVKQCAKTCPSNFPNKQFLLEAELASTQGKIKVALALFNESIKKAQQEGFVHEVGLAYERLAHYQIYLGNSIAAQPLLELAREAYHRWGAQSLAHHVEQQLSVLQ